MFRAVLWNRTAWQEFAHILPPIWDPMLESILLPLFLFLILYTRPLFLNVIVSILFTSRI
jgi:hypothetical protein